LSAALIGCVIAGKYRVERVLGQGGMGVVVAATHIELRQTVAIKILHEGATPATVTRFVREARAAVRLASEHVARVLDVGELDDGSPYMVMEYLAGSDLAEVLQRRGPLPVPEVIAAVLQAGEAITEAHAAGIIHRDLKPANLFLTRTADGSSTVKVLDFGISKTTEDRPEADGLQLTQTTDLLGSPLYMSPEQLQSARKVTMQSDIWSLGAIVYQLLAGRVPFDANTFPELVLMINMQEPPPLSTFRHDVPVGLEAAVLRCLEKKPEARFANVGELAWAIVSYGPLEARRSAERITRTLEAAGIRVERALDTTADPRRLSVPSVPPDTAAGISAANVSPENLADTVAQLSRRKWSMWIAGAVAVAALATSLAFLALRRDAPSKEPVAVPSAIAVVSSPPSVAAPATTAPSATVIPAREPPVVPGSPAPLPAATVAAPRPTPAATLGVAPAGRPPAPRKGAPTASAEGARKNPLEMDIKE
jgi:serine/threonine-protein kinase